MVAYVLVAVKMQLSLCYEVKEDIKMCKQPSFNDMLNLFKKNDYIEIGYITGIKKIYRLEIVDIL